MYFFGFKQKGYFWFQQSNKKGWFLYFTYTGRGVKKMIKSSGPLVLWSAGGDTGSACQMLNNALRLHRDPTWKALAVLLV